MWLIGGEEEEVGEEGKMKINEEDVQEERKSATHNSPPLMYAPTAVG